MKIKLEIYNNQVFDFLKEIESFDFLTITVFTAAGQYSSYPNNVSHLTYSYLPYKNVHPPITFRLSAEITFKTQSDAIHFKLKYS